MSDEVALLPGWQRLGSSPTEWYQRKIVLGPTTLLVDMWHLDGKEWAYVFNGSKAERVRQPTALRAMEAVDVIVSGHMRNAIRSLKHEVQ
jgi:hypothetical protein